MMRPAPLLDAKLLPPSIGPLHLPRPRLTERLRVGLERRATVVLAGPGFGKTGLVAQFLQEEEGDSVWYSLDPSDADPSIFFRYLIQGVKEHAPEFGERTQGFWEALRFRPEEAERLADIFISDAEETLGGRLILVLDGVNHLEGSEPCVRALRRLLAYLPGALHLILIGRSLPDLGLQALQAEGAVSLIEGEDLLFTLEETRVLLRDTLGLPARPGTVGRLHARTRGWVTALQLLRQTARLEEGADDLPESLFARTESEIFDYFSEEVFASESAEVRQFLLGACLPPAIDPDVCADVLEGLDARALLAGLARRQLFISPLESRNAYYAFDPLFLEYLRRKLRAERGADGTRALDRRYAMAFARRGDFSRALEHALASEDAKAVAELLQRHGEALLRAGLPGVVRSAARFLAERGMRPAKVEALLGEACRLAGDHAAAVGHFESCLGERDDGSAEITGDARVSALQGLAYSLLKIGDLARAAETAAGALAETGDADPALRARVLNTLAIVRNRQDRAAEARALWQEALARARQAGDDHLILMVAHNLGLPHAVAGDFRRASECFGILTSPENPRLGPEEGAAYLNLARIETLRGDLARAATHLGDAREIAQKWQLEGLLADVVEEEGTLCRERGDLEAAAAHYARARSLLMELGRLDELDSLSEEEAILAALRGEHDEAESIAAEAAERRRAAGDPEGLASALLALGQVRVRAAVSGRVAGAPARAAEALEKAAAFFASRGRAYQECAARLWLALARHLQPDRHRAAGEGREAMRLAARHDYRAPVLRVVALDSGFRDLLATLPDAPPYLREAPAAGPIPIAGRGAADLSVRLLGPIEVYRHEERRIPSQAWKVQRSLQVFCYLAAARDHRATRDALADALWGASRPSAVERGLHFTISLLRRALNHGHNVPKNFILCERGAYLLNPAYHYDIDIETFEERIGAARRSAGRGDTPGALRDYAAALALYRGPLMQEEYDEWIEAPRAHFEKLRVAALWEAGDLNLAAGDLEGAAACFRTLTGRDPIDVRASAQLMRTLGSLGDREGVEVEFARLQRALGPESSPTPHAEARRARQEALAAAGAPPPGAAATAVGGPATLAEKRPSRRTVRRGPALGGV